MAATQDEVREWARAFHTALVGGAGKSLVQCFAESIEQVSNEQLRHALSNVQSELEQGNSLSRAFALHPDVFEPNFISIVRYGEIYGEVDLTLQRFVERPEDMAPRCRRPAPA